MDIVTKNIPLDLMAKQNWVVWRRHGTRKIPYNPRTGATASADDPTTWTTFQDALAAIEIGGYDGIGFELGVEPDLSGYVVVDLDHVLDGDNLPDEYSVIVDSLDSYTEISQSGSGLHIFVRGKKPGLKCRKGAVEIYDSRRFIAVTGVLYQDRQTINNRGFALENLYAKIFGDDLAFTAPHIAHPEQMDDSEVLATARNNAKTGSAFLELYYDGNTSEYGDDHSRADLALCNYLAYWTGGDSVQIDRLFRESALFRDKWNEKRGDRTYGEITIRKALEVSQSRLNINSTSQTANVLNSAPRKSSMATYMSEFENHLADIANRPALLTGFRSFDNMLCGGLLPELMIIGGGTGTGKTSFVLQIADLIATSGQDVLYFSLEMPRYELAAKSISRLSFLYDSENALTAKDVLMSETSGRINDKQAANLRAAKARYFSEIAGNLFIEEIFDRLTIPEINERIKSHIRDNGKPAVVMIDYIQLIGSEISTAGDKETMDEIMRGLQRIVNAFSIPVIAISSFNRNNYESNKNNARENSKNISLSAFKESGSIEYSANIALGMKMLKTISFSNTREIFIQILKGRFIESNDKSFHLEFHSDYSCFKEISAPNEVNNG